MFLEGAELDNDDQDNPDVPEEGQDGQYQSDFIAEDKLISAADGGQAISTFKAPPKKIQSAQQQPGTKKPINLVTQQHQ